ncbi:hypothetical protein D3C83_22680 [compost metagenome]
MHHLLLPGVHLVIPQQRLKLLAVEVHFEYRGVERLEAEVAQQRLVLDLDVLRGLVGAVDDARHPSRQAQAAARTRSLLRARECCHFDFHLHSPVKRGVRDQTSPG